MKVIASVDRYGDIIAISASPEGSPRAAAVKLGESTVEIITDHDIRDDDSDEAVHRKLNEIVRSRSARAR